MTPFVIVGGGAAGFFAAASLVEARPGSRAVILERRREVLGKVRISGGGRCNVTHACFEPSELAAHYPRGGRELLGPFHRFGPRETMAWFEARGVRLKTEPDGRVFPVSDRSETIVQALSSGVRAAGVAVRTEADLHAIARTKEGFDVSLSGGERLAAGAVLLATGSAPSGHAFARELGHEIVAPAPSLFTLAVKDPRLEGLAGVSVPSAELRLEGHVQTGPLLVTHWGLSGPAALKLSAWAARDLQERGYRAGLRINWLGCGKTEAERALAGCKSRQARRTVAASPAGLPGRLWERLTDAAGIPRDRRWADLPARETAGLLRELTEGEYLTTGKGPFKEEFVTAGGVLRSEVDFRTMESRRTPGLYFAGEILDVDGLTGGFNFQSAWTTGWLAGRAVAERGR